MKCISKITFITIVISFVGNNNDKIKININSVSSFELQSLENVINYTKITSKGTINYQEDNKNLKTSLTAKKGSTKFLLITKNNNDFRIINGHEAKPHSAPYIVSLKRGKFGKHGCAGTIITKFAILTAAHCLKKSNLTDIYAVAGLHDRNIDDNYTQKIRIHYYIRHEKFATNSAENISGPYDIALMFLVKSFQFNDYVKRIQLPDTIHSPPLSNTGTLFGWGRTNAFDQERSKCLQTITTDLLSYDQCRIFLPTNKRLHLTNICTSRIGQGSIACHGDSGGPLVQVNNNNNNNNNNSVIQVGIVSWGFRICGWNSKPSIYTNIAMHLDWIWKNVKIYEETFCLNKNYLNDYSINYKLIYK